MARFRAKQFNLIIVEFLSCFALIEFLLANECFLLYLLAERVVEARVIHTSCNKKKLFEKQKQKGE